MLVWARISVCSCKSLLNIGNVMGQVSCECKHVNILELQVMCNKAGAFHRAVAVTVLSALS